MATKTKKIKASGRFKSGYGTNVRGRLNKVEALQRKKQICPYCSKPGVERQSAGIWNCRKCGKKFASHSYYLEKQA